MTSSVLAYACGAALAVIIAVQHCTITGLDTELDQAQTALRASVESALELHKQIDMCNALLAERDALLAEHEKHIGELNEKLQAILADNAEARDWWHGALPDALARMRDAGTDRDNEGHQTDTAGKPAEDGGNPPVQLQNKR